MMRPTKWGGRLCVAAMAAMLCFGTVLRVQAQNENFSNKPAPVLFNADCTGAGCHKGPQGLGKGQSQSGLAGFLREHYTNSRESAAAIAAYILKLPAGPPAPESRAARASNPRQGERSGPSWFDPEPTGPADARSKERQQQQGGRPSRSAARPADTKPADAKPADAKPADAKPAEPKPAEESAPSESAAAAPAEPVVSPAPSAPPAPTDRRRRTAGPAEPAKPAPTPRNQRGRQQPAVAATPAPAEPPPAPAAPPPPQFDIFD